MYFSCIEEALEGSSLKSANILGGASMVYISGAELDNLDKSTVTLQFCNVRFVRYLITKSFTQLCSLVEHTLNSKLTFNICVLFFIDNIFFCFRVLVARAESATLVCAVS